MCTLHAVAHPIENFNFDPLQHTPQECLNVLIAPPSKEHLEYCDALEAFEAEIEAANDKVIDVIERYIWMIKARELAPLESELRMKYDEMLGFEDAQQETQVGFF